MMNIDKFKDMYNCIDSKNVTEDFYLLLTIGAKYIAIYKNPTPEGDKGVRYRYRSLAVAKEALSQLSEKIPLRSWSEKIEGDEFAFVEGKKVFEPYHNGKKVERTFLYDVDWIGEEKA
jgi:hypothetical protein